MTKADHTRAHITKTALNAVSNQGFSGLSVGFIAQATRMSKSGVFARFGGQAAFQCAVIDAAASKFTAHVIEPARTHDSPAQRLQSIAKHWTAWLTTQGLGQPCPVFQATMEGPALTPAAQTHALKARAQFPAYLARLAARACEAGEFSRDTDPQTFAFEFDGIGLATGFAALTRPTSEVRPQAKAAFTALFDRSQP